MCSCKTKHIYYNTILRIYQYEYSTNNFNIVKIKPLFGARHFDALLAIFPPCVSLTIVALRFTNATFRFAIKPLTIVAPRFTNATFRFTFRFTIKH